MGVSKNAAVSHSRRARTVEDLEPYFEAIGLASTCSHSGSLDQLLTECEDAEIADPGPAPDTRGGPATQASLAHQASAEAEVEAEAEAEENETPPETPAADHADARMSDLEELEALLAQFDEAKSKQAPPRRAPVETDQLTKALAAPETSSFVSGDRLVVLLDADRSTKLQSWSAEMGFDSADVVSTALDWYLDALIAEQTDAD
ncbi:MAG: hypothetical protein AAFQ73_03000 [Pseudomonadota bacterium]